MGFAGDFSKNTRRQENGKAAGEDRQQEGAVTIMNTRDPSLDGGAESRWQRLAPIFALIVLAPGIAEVLSGATRMSVIFVLVPEMMVWGCGALLIREAVRRWGGGSTSMLLMGLGLS